MSKDPPKEAPPFAALISLAEAGARLKKSERTMRRLLPALMLNNPSLSVTRVGRSVMFTEAQFAALLKALEWRIPTAGLAQRHMRVTSSTLARRDALSGKTAQEMLRERLRKPATKPTKSRNP